VIDNGNQIGVPNHRGRHRRHAGAQHRGDEHDRDATWLGTNANHCWDISWRSATLGLDNVLTCAGSDEPEPELRHSSAFTSVDQPCGQTPR
jgi:hypothetical protein